MLELEGIPLSFTTEEVAVIDGVMCAQILPRTGAGATQSKYLTVLRHLHDGLTDHDDLRSIREMLLFLLPVYDGERQAQRDMVHLLSKTNAMLKAV